MLLTSVPVVATVGTVAVALLFWDLLQRELGARPSTADRPVRWTAVVRPLARTCRFWGLSATVAFTVLVALRFVALGT